MILFFRKANIIYAVDARKSLPAADIAKLTWLFSEAKQLDAEVLNGIFIGPRREMITPWSTNAVEITQNMGLEGIARIEEFEVVKSEDAPYDPDVAPYVSFYRSGYLHDPQAARSGYLHR